MTKDADAFLRQGSDDRVRMPAFISWEEPTGREQLTRAFAPRHRAINLHQVAEIFYYPKFTRVSVANGEEIPAEPRLTFELAGGEDSGVVTIDGPQAAILAQYLGFPEDSSEEVIQEAEERREAERRALEPSSIGPVNAEKFLAGS